jgi:hypothetical protein
MRLTKNEKEWIELIITERLSKIDKQVFQADDEDKRYILGKTKSEREALTGTLEKL